MFQQFPSGYAKLAASWLGILAILFMPFRSFSTDPVLAGLMPVSKRFGAVSAFIFAFTSIALHDAFTSGIGVWTWITASVYGGIGIGSNWYFQRRAASWKDFLGFGLGGVLVFDALTGLTIGPIFYHQPFWDAFFKQLPVTFMRLAGTAFFALTLSPLLYWWFGAEKTESGALVRSRT